jgi:hypothetical protein
MKTKIFALILFFMLCFLNVMVFGLYGMLDESISNKGQISWEKGTISVIGRGAAKLDANKAVAPILAERAAITVAQRNALEILEGVRVCAGTYVKDLTLESDIIRTQVEGLIKGAQVGSSVYSDGVCTVTLIVPVGSLTSLMLEQMNQKSSLSVPSVAPDIIPENTDSSIAYTGLIIDARNLGVKGALSPQVFEADTHFLVYGASLVKVDKSIVIYARSLEKVKEDNQERLGNNPLVVKAVGAIKVNGEATDVIISTEDSETFRKAQTRDEICANAAVAIIIN